MQTGVKEILINGYCYHGYGQDYLDSMLKEIETLGVDEQYSLLIHYFVDEEEEIKQIFETLIMKQKPNLIRMGLSYLKLFPNSFRLFSEKRWEKLN